MWELKSEVFLSCFPVLKFFLFETSMLLFVWNHAQLSHCQLSTFCQLTPFTNKCQHWTVLVFCQVYVNFLSIAVCPKGCKLKDGSWRVMGGVVAVVLSRLLAVPSLVVASSRGAAAHCRVFSRCRRLLSCLLAVPPPVSARVFASSRLRSRLRVFASSPHLSQPRSARTMN